MVRFSNAPVENRFGLVKNNIPGGQRNLKCGRFINTLKQSIFSLYKECCTSFPTKRCATSNRRKLTTKTQTDHEVIWQKCNKKGHTYFELKLLRKINQKLKSDQINEETCKQSKFLENGLCSMPSYYKEIAM